MTPQRLTLPYNGIVSGWALDSSGIKKVEVLVDGNVIGQAVYGLSRPDIYTTYPAYNNKNAGYQYNLDTANLVYGSHTLTVKATPTSGQPKTLTPVNIVISNPIPRIKIESSERGANLVKGWFLDFSGVAGVNVLVDGVFKGSAITGNFRLGYLSGLS